MITDEQFQKKLAKLNKDRKDLSQLPIEPVLFNRLLLYYVYKNLNISETQMLVAMKITKQELQEALDSDLDFSVFKFILDNLVSLFENNSDKLLKSAQVLAITNAINKIDSESEKVSLAASNTLMKYAIEADKNSKPTNLGGLVIKIVTEQPMKNVTIEGEVDG